MSQEPAEKDILFEAKKIRKVFGATVALDDVDLTVYRGEIRGLIGENGSGKSTLSSIAAGMQAPTSGQMFFKGEPYSPQTMVEGGRAGFGMIVQETGTISGITVAQNIFLGNEDRFRHCGLIRKKAMNNAARRALDAIGFDGVSPDAYIDTLDMQERKLVEVARVMWEDPEILVVDETTTALSQRGRQIIYDIMEKMKAQGKAVLFISHDLEETMIHCDTLTVLRDGHLVDTVTVRETSEHQIKNFMVGREIGEHYYREDHECTYQDEVVLEADHLTTGRGLLKNCSFQLHKGEILGIGGLSHCGMHELGRALFGEEPVIEGKVVHRPSGELIKNAGIAIRHEMGYVSKDRDREALIASASIKDNIIGAAFDRVTRAKVFISPKLERRYVQRLIETLRIKCASMDQNVQYLSGGNKQKVVFAKWVGRRSRILILDCPTRGVDIGVKASMYELMENMKREGSSILMISEEMTELLGMCDRILVLKDGVIAKEFKRSPNLSESDIIEYMI